MLDVLGLRRAAGRRGGAARRGASTLAELRERRARDKDWAEADRLRDELRAMGWEVRDGPDGPELVRAS